LVFYESWFFLQKAGRWVKGRFTGWFHGQPQYMDIETGLQWCGFREQTHTADASKTTVDKEIGQAIEWLVK